MRLGSGSFILLLLAFPFVAWSQTGVSRLRQNPTQSTSKSAWSTNLRYSALSDFADDRSPRAYIHNLLLSTSYNFNKNWSVDASLGLRAETLNGQIEKRHEQTYDEVLGPSTSFSLNYGETFFSRHNYAFYLQGEPLWDEASRLEGYKGLVGVGGRVSFSFFNRRYIMSHDLSYTELLNSFKYGSDLLANPDYFYTYRMSNVVRIYKALRFSYTFGAKVTRYLDNFVGYSYSNSVGLSYSWPHWLVGLNYDNGGFTDKGEISLWYLDEYRRLARMNVGYTF